jgi:hypothetical protein
MSASAVATFPIGVNPHAQEPQACCGCRTDCRIVLTNPASKDQHVEPVRGRCHGGYLTPQAVQV